MKNDAIEIVRRLGPETLARGYKCVSLQNCPDLFESASGSFVVIGRDVTEELKARLPEGSGCGPDERIIEIPRRTLVLAKADIPDRL